MTNLVLAMVGRYILSGMIMYGLLFIVIVARLTVALCRGCNNGAEATIRARRLSSWTEEAKIKQASKTEMAIRYLVWPYGVIKSLKIYLKEEPKIIRKMVNGN